MRILITNDDGIHAPGLKTLHAIATTIAGPQGEVWTVAPAYEQSGVAHCISYTRPMMVERIGKHAFSIEGSPADCVLAALHDSMKDSPPDLVLSGVNRGNNAAENAMYSGTIGGAMEAALQGIPAIAMSQYFGPANRVLDDAFEAAAEHGADVVRRIIDATPAHTDGYRLFYNVNFPPTAAADVQGIRLAPQGIRSDTSFSTTPHVSPQGRRYLWIQGADQQIPTAAHTDAALNLNGFITVTPMRADFTAHDSFAALEAINT
ncbi:5'/3'-nucleotidase SurE [Sulfitobacter sp.]|jgi:5'-nucleotidase|uniref:5'/3'-nucleotidase SurE n=1 Tax=Sulfitobacter sp. TaxID=1903071 RepID=UPI0039E30970